MSESLELLWLDPKPVPRIRNQPRWRSLLDSERERRTDREPDTGESHTEQGATPFEQQGRGRGLAPLEGVGELACRIARVDERIRELGMRVARAGRRLDPGEQLARPVQPVLERAESADHVRV